MENTIKIIELIVENSTLFVALLCVIIVMVQKIIEFIALPTTKKISEIKTILLEWVRESEADLKNGTGKFKLAQVYEKFCIQYPYLKKWYSLEKFEKLVDDALAEMSKEFDDEMIKINALKLNK
ncbi:MAG: hypothetical protein RR806_05615 [Oscillospiraceae bacterium]